MKTTNQVLQEALRTVLAGSPDGAYDAIVDAGLDVGADDSTISAALAAYDREVRRIALKREQESGEESETHGHPEDIETPLRNAIAIQRFVTLAYAERVILARAGSNPSGVDGVRQPDPIGGRVAA